MLRWSQGQLTNECQHNFDCKHDNENTQFMVYSYFASRPSLSVCTTREKLTAGAGENFIEFTATQNKLKIFMGDTY